MQQLQKASTFAQETSNDSLEQKNSKSARVMHSMESLEEGEMVTIKLDGNTDEEPVALAIPLGSAPSVDSKNKANHRFPTPKPSSASPHLFDESNPVFRTTLAVLCTATILLGCAVIGSLVVKSIRHYQVLNYEDD